MKTRIPFNCYFLFAITATVFILLLDHSFWKLFFYTVLVFFIVYIHFCRYACEILLTNDEIHVKYLFPWHKNISVKIKDIMDVDYRKGFYDMFSEKTKGGIFVFPQYCYDTIILNLRTNDLESAVHIKVNTRVFEFNRLIETLRLKMVQSDTIRK